MTPDSRASTITDDSPPSSRPAQARQRFARQLVRGIVYFILSSAAILSVLPLVWLFLSAFKPVGEIFRSPPALLPDSPTLDSFTGLLDALPFGLWVWNSIWVSTVGTVIASLISAMGGYAFAKFEFRGRNFLFGFVIFALMVPFLTILVPLFHVTADIGLVGSTFAVLIPYLAPPVGLFAMRQYVAQSIPDELLNAAKVDGAGQWRTFFVIVLPMLRPGLAAIAIWIFFHIYTAFLWPLTVVGGGTDSVITVGLSVLATGFAPEFGWLMAGASMAAVPTLVLFLIFGKRLQEGMTLGALKG